MSIFEPLNSEPEIIPKHKSCCCNCHKEKEPENNVPKNVTENDPKEDPKQEHENEHEEDQTADGLEENPENGEDGNETEEHPENGEDGNETEEDPENGEDGNETKEDPENCEDGNETEEDDEDPEEDEIPNKLFLCQIDGEPMFASKSFITVRKAIYKYFRENSNSLNHKYWVNKIDNYKYELTSMYDYYILSHEMTESVAEIKVISLQ